MKNFSLYDDKMHFISDFSYEQMNNLGDEIDFLIVRDNIIPVDKIMSVKDGLLNVKVDDCTDSFFGLKAKEMRYTDGKPYLKFNYERRLRHATM